MDVSKLRPTEKYKEHLGQQSERHVAATEQPLEPAPRYNPTGRDMPEPITQMPSYEKLNENEKALYNALPRIQQKTEGVREAVQNANLEWAASWSGKALNVLDVLAEGAERFSGFAAQALWAAGSDDDGFSENLSNAWYAGSLAADMANLPKL